MKKVLYFLKGVLPTEEESASIASLNEESIEVLVRDSSKVTFVEGCDFVAGSVPAHYAGKNIYAKAHPQDKLAPLFKRQYTETSTVVTDFQSGNGWTFGSGVQNNSVDHTSDFAIGTQCAAWTTAGAGAQSACRKYGYSPAFNLTDKIIKLRFKFEDITNLNDVIFFAGSSNLSNAFKWSFQGLATTKNAQFAQSGEWVVMTLSLADVTSTVGTPDATNITDFSFAVYDNSSGTVTTKLQSVELVDIPVELFPDGAISITFDDNYDSVFTKAYPKMKALGFKGVSYNIVELVGTSGRMTLDQMKELKREGWEMSAHSYATATHNSAYTALNPNSIRADFKSLKNWIYEKGFSFGEGFSWPNGKFNLFTLNCAREFWSYARTIVSKHRETLPPADRYKLRAASSISSYSGGYSAATLTNANTGWIDKCKANKTWLILVFHQITDGAPSATTQCSKVDFDAIMDKIAASGVPVLTVREVLDKLGE